MLSSNTFNSGDRLGITSSVSPTTAERFTSFNIHEFLSLLTSTIVQLFRWQIRQRNFRYFIKGYKIRQETFAASRWWVFAAAGFFPSHVRLGSHLIFHRQNILCVLIFVSLVRYYVFLRGRGRLPSLMLLCLCYTRARRRKKSVWNFPWIPAMSDRYTRTKPGRNEWIYEWN